MTINKTTTDLSTLKINYLTQEMYEDALENDEINENELYITPGSGGGTSNTLLYGVCDTAADTAAKTATIDSSFELVEGATIAIKFTNTNTIVNPTLNINNTGAKAIKNYGTTNAGVRPYTSWSEGEVVPLLYDGTYWQIMYNMAQNNSVLQTHSTSNSNYNLALSSYTTSSTGTISLNHSTKIKGNPSTGRITTEDMTSQEVDNFVDGLNISGGNILDIFYPVGSYYETSDTTFNPNTAWGGTWVQDTQIHEKKVNLYNGTFTSGSATLNESIENFFKLEITYATNDEDISTLEVVNNYTNSFMVSIDKTRIISGWYAKAIYVAFSTTTMSSSNNKQAYFSTVSANGTYISIKRVDGYVQTAGYIWHRTA